MEAVQAVLKELKCGDSSVGEEPPSGGVKPISSGEFLENCFRGWYMLQSSISMILWAVTLEISIKIDCK